MAENELGTVELGSAISGDWAQFVQLVKSEVDKANRRLSRMNDFQKRIFADKGITQISRAGGAKEKMEALAKAKIVNESGISTKTEYNEYVKTLAGELPYSRKEVDWILGQVDARARDFIGESKLHLGYKPQLDFLFSDVMALSDTLETNLQDLMDYLNRNDKLLNEVDDLSGGYFKTR